MKATLLGAILLSAISGLALAADAGGSAPQSRATPLDGAGVEIDGLSSQSPTESYQKICKGKYCCFWGNNGDFWTCF